MKKLALCFILVLGIAASGCSGGGSSGSKSGGATTAGEDTLGLVVENGNNNGDWLVTDIVGDTDPDIVADIVADTVGDEVPDIVGDIIVPIAPDTFPDIDNTSEVPEPGSLILLGSGLMGLALHRLRRLKK